MNKNLLARLIASSIVVGSVTELYAQDVNLPASTKRIQRSFVNMNLQLPKVSTSYVLLDANPSLVGQTQYIPGWRTTHTKYSNKEYPMEFWRGGGPDGITANPNSSSSDNQYVELNAEEASNIYQSICLLPDDTFSGSFDHATRVSAVEKAEFFIAQINDRTITSRTKHIIDSADHTTAKTWKTTTFNSISVADKVTTAGKYEFVFQAKAWSGTNSTYGNFIDNVNIKLRPAIEFSAASGSVFENETGQVHSIDFNIVGNVKSDMKVSFIIDNDSVPNPASWEEDYELYSRTVVNNVETLTPINLVKVGNNYTFDYEVKYDSKLDYDAGVKVKGLVVKVKNNNLLNGDKIIPFALKEVQTGGTVVLSTGEVCGNTPISTFQYTIKDDDTDLTVTKSLNDIDLYPSKEVSYDLIVENKSTLKNSTSTALNVVLKDTLLANLTRDASTQLSCEVITNDGVTGVCPVMSSPTNAATQLFSENGLTIGSLPAKAKLKFTVSKLKVAATESGQNNYKNFIVNKAQVTTTSNDIDLSNNESTATDPYPFLSDLSNKVVGPVDDTGIGLFYIAKGGRTGTKALLTKSTDQNAPVYFPLLIENKAPYAQDYRLHASSTAIATLNETDYSRLDETTISSFASGLEIKFYLANEGECKAGLNANPISQVNVAAQSSTQVCAQIHTTALAKAQNPIWFAIESVQTGLGDIIKNEVTYALAALRQLILVNDQQAQVNVGGTYVFSHRLSNEGSIIEDGLQLSLSPLNPTDNFSYSLFLDKNNNGMLDTGDELVQPTTVIPSLNSGSHLSLLVKVQAPATATHGLRSQVNVNVLPKEIIDGVVLSALSNLDTITVGSNQLSLQKTQFKQTSCTDLSASQIKSLAYRIGSLIIGRNDCIIYRIEAQNIGSERLTSVAINDMYPAYTTPWTSNGALPMTDSNDAVTHQSGKITTSIAELLPGEKKSLYFGIKLQ